MSLVNIYFPATMYQGMLTPLLCWALTQAHEQGRTERSTLRGRSSSVGLPDPWTREYSGCSSCPGFRPLPHFPETSAALWAASRQTVTHVKLGARGFSFPASSCLALTSLLL